MKCRFSKTIFRGEDCMISRFAIVALSAIMLAQAGWAASFTVKIDTGSILIRQSKAGFWTPVKDSVLVAPGDSLFMDEKYSAAIKMGKGTKLALKGETRLSLQGSDTGIAVNLDLGQVFLIREDGPEVKSVKIVAVGCVFSPVGTAAAIKLTKAREPSVAVVRGKMRMDAPSGETMVVEPGNFGTFSSANGKLKTGKISPEALASLEKWSGVALEPVAAEASVPQKPDSAQQPNASGNTPAASPATQPVSGPSTAPASASATQPAAAPAPAAEKPVATSATTPEAGPAAAAGAEKSKEAPPAEEKKESSGAPEAPARVSWEISANSVTVDGMQWTRLTISPDIPIWKFGLGLDIECFLDEKGSFSEKGWEFDKKNWQTSLSRKLKYVRFGHEKDPLFVKVGGLSNVTLGYGFIVDRFTNLLHYPDQKLVGVQFYLNDIGPAGITLQTMAPDLMEFKGGNGGIVTGRLAFAPLKSMKLPLFSALSVGATYATDLNEFAPARSWRVKGTPSDKNGNGLTDWDYAYSHADTAHVKYDMAHKIVDSSTISYGKFDSTSKRRYSLLGADIGMPIVKTGLLGIDVYGQGGIVADSNMFKSKNTGWGFGAPGVQLTAAKGIFVAQVEYRHVHGKFTPGYFGTYYLDERLQRYPVPTVKSDSLPSVDLDGIFGLAGVNVFNLVTAEASYQYMAGANDELDQRFEARGNIGEAILKRIPKLNKLEMYLYKTDINRTVVVYTPKGKIFSKNGKPIYDEFLEQTPKLFWGYRIGVEIAKGASLIWDTRYGYQWDATYHLVPNNNISIGTVITF